MSAGLPGVGLSGLFFVVSALLMLPLEVARTIRGRSSRERWAAVLRHVAIAVTMIIVLELAYLALQLALELLAGSPGAGHGHHAGSGGIRILPTTPLLITLGVIVALVCTAKLAQLLSSSGRSSGAQSPLPVATSNERHAAFGGRRGLQRSPAALEARDSADHRLRYAPQTTGSI